jgi:protein-S-isoprenylcysteine O-methyltransferase Ste14
MARSIHLIFGILAYAIFFATFLYLIAFLANVPIVPLTVDVGPQVAPLPALAIDLALVAMFGVQHSVMARQSFKRAWTRIVPPAIERSVYVLAASLMLILLFACWRPVPATVWRVEAPIGVYALWALCGLGWATVLLSTFLLNHFELFGLQQVWFNLRGRLAAEPELRRPLLYKLVRHPLYSGFFMAFWATPAMSVGHLALAAGMSAYMLIAIRYEERDLIGLFGNDYVRYRREVGMLAPRLRRPSIR